MEIDRIKGGKTAKRKGKGKDVKGKSQRARSRRARARSMASRTNGALRLQLRGVQPQKVEKEIRMTRAKARTRPKTTWFATVVAKLDIWPKIVGEFGKLGVLMCQERWCLQ